MSSLLRNRKNSGILKRLLLRAVEGFAVGELVDPETITRAVRRLLIGHGAEEPILAFDVEKILGLSQSDL